MIVPPAVIFHQHFGLSQISKDLRAEQFIPQAAVERLDVRVLPRTARVVKDHTSLDGLIGA